MKDALPILLLLALLAVFYLIVLRPARRSQQETATLQRNLAVGDDVVLSAGIFGTIRRLEETRVGLEIAPGTVIEVARQVVVRRVAELPDADRPSAGEQAPTDDDRPSAG